MTTLHNIKGYVAGAIALIACPCHLPITFPLLLGLTAGTALGSWLEGRFDLVLGIATVIFVGGLGLALLWSGRTEEPEARLQTSKKRRVPQGHATAPVTVTIVTSSTCKSCDQAKAVWEQVGQEQPLQIEVVDITSKTGRDLAATHNIFATPTSVVNGKVVARGVPTLKKAKRAMGG